MASVTPTPTPEMNSLAVNVYKPKRGVRPANATLFSAMQCVGEITAPSDASHLPIIERPALGPIPASTIINVESADGTLDFETQIPSFLFPMGDERMLPVAFEQTLSSCKSSRPVVNRETSHEFLNRLFGEHLDLHRGHSAYLGFVDHSVVVIPTEHPHAAAIVHRIASLLQHDHVDRPAVFLCQLHSGDGHYNKSPFHLSAALWHVIFRNNETILGRYHDFFHPTRPRRGQAGGARAPSAAPRGRAPSTKAGPSRASSSAPPSKKRKTLLAAYPGGKGLMSGPLLPVPSPQRGMTPSTVQAMRSASVRNTILRDTRSDLHDVLYATAAITVIESHLDREAFSEFMESISMLDNIPVDVYTQPAAAIAEAITEVLSEDADLYPSDAIDALNTLADSM